jgi:hypothetical protein
MKKLGLFKNQFYISLVFKIIVALLLTAVIFSVTIVVAKIGVRNNPRICHSNQLVIGSTIKGATYNNDKK